jgi:hypothetical protein
MFGMKATMIGPLFEGAPGPKIQAATKQAMERVGLQAQRWVQEQLYPGHGVRTGYFRRSVESHVEAWNVVRVGSDVIYGSWLEEGPHGRQHPGSFKGYGMFANAAQRVEQANIASDIGRLIVEKFT